MSLSAVASYLRLELTLLDQTDDLLMAELWAWGTLGVEQTVEKDGSRHVVAYFSDPLPTRLPDAGNPLWSHLGAELVRVELIEDQDWLADYRRQARPVPVGERFLVDPREPEAEQPPTPGSRRLLRIPARSAFGTGSHESTRLAVELLETIPVAGRRVLDVGTGSGILAFAALCSGAEYVVGIDSDPVASLLAGQNGRLNGLSPHLLAGTLDTLRSGPVFDVALVNILPKRIRPDLPRLVEVLAPGAEAVFSGILAVEKARVAADLAAVGFRRLATGQDGEWVAFHLERADT
ncbi:MAG: 50S ribosomal protein L11 methyltransferase [Thermoanaerobaculia bacterium]